MKISPSSLNLKQFLTGTKEQFFIPAYQRRYAWGIKQQRDLFEDLQYLGGDDNHLLGTIVFLTDTHQYGLNSLEVVDGQQRLTSLTILIKALANQFCVLASDGDQRADECFRETRSYLNCIDGDNQSHPKIWLGDLDRPDYQAIMDSQDLSSDFSHLVNKSLLSAYSNYTKWLADLSQAELYDFFSKLTSNTTVIRLDVSQAKDAYKLFEMINNRGLRLQPTDTIKNFLLGHASNIDDAVLTSVKTDWQKLIIALDGLNADDFLRQWLAGKLNRKVSKNKIVTEFRHYYSSRVTGAEGQDRFVDDDGGDSDEGLESEEGDEADIGHSDDALNDSASSKGEKGAAVDRRESAGKGDKSGTGVKALRRVSLKSFVGEMRRAAELYARIRHADMKDAALNRSLDNLRRINTLPAVTWLLDMFARTDVDRKTKLKLLRALEAFMMRRHICSMRTSELDSIFASMANLPKQRYEQLALEKLREHTPTDPEFARDFASYQFVPAVIGRARYALEQIEYHLHHGHGEMAVADPSVVEVEHIIPKAANKRATKKEFGDWPTYLGTGWKRDYEKSLHRIGNLTLLSGSLNVAASNNPFLAKKQEYKKSSIKITNRLGGLNQFRLNAVQKRSEEFAKLAVKIWRV